MFFCSFGSVLYLSIISCISDNICFFKEKLKLLFLSNCALIMRIINPLSHFKFLTKSLKYSLVFDMLSSDEILNDMIFSKDVPISYVQEAKTLIQYKWGNFN